MTEADWLVCADPQAMLVFLHRKGSDRKIRLYVTAWCRRGWAVLTNPMSRRAVEVSEQFADGLASLEELELARDQAGRQVNSSGPRALPRSKAALAHLGLLMAVEVTAADAWDAANAARAWWGNARKLAEYEELATREATARVHLLRDIFGNPFRHQRIDRAFLTPTVLSIAQAIYDDRVISSGEFAADRLAILADALEDAGCTDAELLAHLHGPGPHVRGCWSLDLLLNKK